MQSVELNQIRTIPSSQHRNVTGGSKCTNVLKFFFFALLGAITAVGIGLPLGIYATNTLSTTSAPISTTANMNTTTLTTTTATTATTSSTSTSTTSTRTTTTTSITTTTTSTATTTQPRCASPCLCAGISSFTSWQSYPTIGIFMDVDTTSCFFTRTPAYYTSIAGTSDHWELTGHSAIYSPTNTTFRIYVRSRPGWSTSTLLSSASTFAWNVNWVGMYN